ncbi:hypothetical protein EF909_15755 [Streptomyces sp. WAC01280]|nr:hypothetical protein EF909_15755 [Streptomyces sp. WAC01280]
MPVHPGRSRDGRRRRLLRPAVQRRCLEARPGARCPPCPSPRRQPCVRRACRVPPRTGRRLPQRHGPRAP